MVSKPVANQWGGGSGRAFPGQKPSIRFRARKIPRECTPRPTFRKMLPKKNSFWRKINISLRLPEFREFFSHFRETWRSGLVSGDSRKFRETWQVCLHDYSALHGYYILRNFPPCTAIPPYTAINLDEFSTLYTTIPHCTAQASTISTGLPARRLFVAVGPVTCNYYWPDGPQSFFCFFFLPNHVLYVVPYVGF